WQFWLNETFCLENLLHESFGDPVVPPVQTCVPKHMSLYQLYYWKDQLEAEYGDDFEGTDVADLFSIMEFQSNLVEKSACAYIIFCTNDLRIISHNLYAIECSYTVCGQTINYCDVIITESGRFYAECMGKNFCSISPRPENGRSSCSY